MNYINSDKYLRAKEVVTKKGKAKDADSVEAKAYSMAVAEHGADAKEEVLIEAVYKIIGGAVSGEVKTDDRVGVISEKHIGKEKEELPISGRRSGGTVGRPRKES